MSRRFIQAILGVYRQLGSLERDAICCGTVTVQQCFALQLLLMQSPRDNGEIARLTNVTPGAATRLVDGMVKRGWVQRSVDPDDRRHMFIELTAAGQAEAERLVALTEERMGELLKAIPRSKRAMVVESIELLGDALSHPGEPS